MSDDRDAPPASPPRAPRSRSHAEAASVWAPSFTLAFGLLLSLVAWGLYGAVPGRMFGASAVLVALVLLVARPRVVRSARVGSLVGLVAFGYVALCFVGLSAAAAYHLASGGAGLALLATGVCLSTLATAYHARRRRDEWEHEREHNVGVALDRHAATYAFGADRGFRYGASTRSSQSPPSRTWLLVGLGGGVAAGLPALFPRETATDPRTYVVLLLGLPMGVLLSPLLATAYTTWSKLRAFERELGREIVNR